MHRIAAAGLALPRAGVFALLTGDRYHDAPIGSEASAPGAERAEAPSIPSVLQSLRFDLPPMACAYSEALGGPSAVAFTTTKHRLVDGKHVAKRRAIDFIMLQDGKGTDSLHSGAARKHSSSPAGGSSEVDKPDETGETGEEEAAEEAAEEAEAVSLGAWYDDPEEGKPGRGARVTMRLEQVLGLPAEDDIGDDRLPCERMPSDHLLVAAELSFRFREDDKDEKGVGVKAREANENKVAAGGGE